MTLFHAMPEPIRSGLALDSQEDSFERYRDVFTNRRYPYELGSWKFSDPVLMRSCGGLWPIWLAIQGARFSRSVRSWIT
ncbi:hypothetical protein EMIT0P4_80148 [Pseudomonas sp. IT-P4]